MDLGVVDRAATRGRSALHRAAPASKLVAFALVLAAVVLSANLLVVLAVLCVLLTAVVGLRLPARPMLSLAAYAGLFALLFALAAAPDVLSGALIVAKAVTAALSAVTLMFTTPYPQVFAPLQRFVPTLVGDALLMTYRSLFLLAETFGHTLTAARLRAGIAGAQPFRSAGTVARSLGSVVLYSIDLSQRTYDVMHLRGYEGRLVVTARRSTAPWADAAAIIIAASVLAVALAFRLAPEALAPYAWVPLLASLAALAVAGARLALAPGRTS